MNARLDTSALPKTVSHIPDENTQMCLINFKIRCLLTQPQIRKSSYDEHQKLSGALAASSFTGK